LYLTGPFSPEALIIGMLLAPRLDFTVPTLEIVRIRRQPSLVALPLAFRPARRIMATLLGLPCPWIRPIKSATVDTPLLPCPYCFHTLILTDEVAVELTSAWSGNKRNEIHQMWGMGIKGRINVGPLLTEIRSVFGIAYTISP